MHTVPIRGKPRTLERTMMNRGSMDGGGEERAIGDLDDFLKDFILLDLGARDPSVWSDVTPSLDQAQAQSIVDKERVLS